MTREEFVVEVGGVGVVDSWIDWAARPRRVLRDWKLNFWREARDWEFEIEDLREVPVTVEDFGSILFTIE